MVTSQGSNSGPLCLPPGGPYFTNNATGTIQRQSNPVLATGLCSSGWTGFATMAEAKAFATSGPAGTVKAPVEALHTGIDAVGAFFNRLTEGNTWLRIAEGTLGIILIAVALAKLTGADNVIAKTATTAAKAAVL